MADSWTHYAKDPKYGMTLDEIGEFYNNSKKVGVSGGAVISGIVGFTGRQREITAKNDNSPRRLR